MLGSSILEALMNSPFFKNSTEITRSYSSKPRYWQLGLVSFFTSLTVLISQDTPLLAQITPDNTLEAEHSVVTPNAQVRGRLADLIEGGAIREANLFHSFLEFNIEEGQRVYFANPVGIETIFSRVTGNNPSAILGTLGVNGEANLFFLNPNGIIFGAKAQLDIQGSFVASTANSVVFEDGSSFSATNPEDSSLLTISVPLGLQYGQPAAVVNAGNLAVGEGENLTLAGGTVVNSGQLSAPGGTISLAAVPSQGLIHLDLTGQVSSVDLPFNNDTGEVLSAASGLATLLENAGLTEADIPIDFNLGTVAILGSVDASNPLGSGGEINVTGNRIQLLNGVINSGGVIGGEINLTSTFLENRGEIQADGERGGNLNINVTNFLDTGVLSATGNAGDGGTIQVDYQGTVIQTATALTSVTGSEKAGRIRFQGGQVFTTSGNLQAQGELGGKIQLFGERLQLLGTTVNASGNQGGGEILVGGDYQGNTVEAQNADYTLVNHATTLQADGLTVGDGGKVIVWADGETDFYGNLTARGGALTGNGGVLEVSGKGSLVFGGLADASAANGVAGELLLDPKNITIDTAVTGNSFQLFDPNPAAGNQFGENTAVLANNNIVVSSPNDDLMAQNGGAVYLFDSNTGAVLGSIYGDQPGDRFGSGEITALSNDNYVFANPEADIEAVGNAGTVILANGTTGAEIRRISGTNRNDFFGSGEITGLSNGNYVFGNPFADIGGMLNAGTVILANGITGAEINRISGANPNDLFGNRAITGLSNGNYVFANTFAEIDGVENAGTVILANGITGAEISRISGTKQTDNFGSNDITALSNGNYVFGNQEAEIGVMLDAGTVILANGTTGEEISRIYGINTNNSFGSGEITALSNGNYVFGNPADIGTVGDAGTVILANGTTGEAIRRISGTNPNDSFGSGEITALSNGNYVFGNSGANIQGVGDAGTVILADGITGEEIDRISGTNPDDRFGNREITALSNGNYVFGNLWADIGGVQNAGTVILANGTTGTEIDRISGTNPDDFFGNGDIRILSDGNYVFANPNADIGRVVDAGTVILADGTTGKEISRISGTNQNDRFGSGEITALSNGNYLVTSPAANNNAGRVDIGIANPASLTHSYFPNRNITVTPATITRITNTGTPVTLQANNDITVNQAIITNNPTGSRGALSLEAGRSILLNADIITDNGNLSLLANQPFAPGVINSQRDPGAANITMKPGTTINTGFGDVTLELDTGAGLTNNIVGTITLDNINAETLTVDSAGAILGNGILTIKGTGITSLNAGNSDIILNQNNDFRTLSINGGRTVIINDRNDINLSNSSVFGNFNVNARGDITSQDIFNPSGSITLTSTNGSINTTRGTLRTFSLGAGGAIALSAQGNITLGNLDARGVNGGGNITLTSQGRIASANSFIRSSTMSPSSDSGQAGDITIQAESVSFADTILSASTLGSGKGGTITINAAEFVELLNDSLVLTTTTGNGDAGDIEITTTQLNIFNGSQIGTATTNQGAGGTITVNASDRIRIAGTAADGVPSGLFTAALSGSTGVAGDLAIATQTLSLENGSQISARSQGEGNAGKIALTISDTFTATDSSILTATAQSAGGAIHITAADIRLWGDSDITTSVSSGGDNGGNIMITADSILAFADSDILAFARDGRGGDITLNTPIFFGFGYTPAAKGTDPATLDHNQRVDINADAAIDGIITIPDLTFIENSLIDLPDNFIDTDNLIANSCMVRADQQNGRFIITGAGNLPPRPGDLTISPYSTGTVRMIPTESTTRPWQKGDPIVESTGVYRLPDGRLVISQDCS
ncbi:two-partner secretion domain-containing protein [Coleofasciculus sp. F4-SAH-05]|uniref:two-partner secretion domain-containing protein n=1 Tax=Coleofasciculus sp. F4-SAH-05 TaxID=3069525 RepID=UPI0033024FB2